MNEYPWYEEVRDSPEIMQGDIIAECMIPLPTPDVYGMLSKVGDAPYAEGGVEVLSADLVVLSQACDLVNDKVDSVVLCPVWLLSLLVEKHPYFKSRKARESLRQGREPAYHLLNEYSSKTKSIGFSVVDFHRIYSLPKQYLAKIAVASGIRLRLLPPYREHLSQAFARYFMRVGLPVDIEKENVQNI